MILTDIIALAKAGYSVSDVKELMALNVNNDTVPPTESNPVTDNNVLVNEEQTAEPTKTEPEPAIDYKLLYEESQKLLKEAQNANLKQPMAPITKTSVDDVLNDILL